MFLSFRTIFLFIFLISASCLPALSQNIAESKEKAAKVESEEKAAKEKKDKKEEKPKKQQGADLSKLTSEQVAELAIAVYGTRENLNQIRKTTFERGKIRITNAAGKTETADYERWITRGENLNKEKIRFDQKFPDAKYSLVYNGEKIFGLYNDSVFMPRDDASTGFQNQIWRGLEGLLRYKENESKLELAGREKILGVDFFLLDVIDKQNRKTRFYVSSKFFRVMMLEYEENAVKYRRKFYDYNYAQGTLVPYRTILWANDRQVEETEIGTITFGQKIGDDMFQEG